MTAYEIRWVKNSQFEARNKDNKFQIAGYAAVFDSKTNIAGVFDEMVKRGAFKKTLQEADVRALFNHDPMFVLGRNRSGTLRMLEDEHGLHYEVDLPDTTFARDLYESVQRGDISQSSFQFIADPNKVDWIKEGRSNLRVLREVRLIDVSPVTMPAYEDTSVNTRAADIALQALAEQRSLALDVVKNNLSEVIAGEYEPQKRTHIPALLESDEEIELMLKYLK